LFKVIRTGEAKTVPELFLYFLTFVCCAIKAAHRTVPQLVDKAFCPGDPAEQAKSTNSK